MYIFLLAKSQNKNSHLLYLVSSSCVAENIPVNHRYHARSVNNKRFLTKKMIKSAERAWSIFLKNNASTGGNDPKLERKAPLDKKKNREMTVNLAKTIKTSIFIP